MKKIKRILLRAAAFVTLVFFTSECLFAQEMGTRTFSGLDRKRYVSPSPEVRLIPISFDIPPSIGKIEERFGNAPSLFLIQDPHGQLEGQRNIGKILEFLREKTGFETLLIEGGVGKQDPDLLRFFTEEKFNQEAAEILLREAEIGGPEIFLLNSPKDKHVIAYGLEEAHLYIKNLELFQKVLRAKPQTDRFLNQNLTRLKTQASQKLNPRLHRFFKEWLRYEQSQMDFTAFLQTLQKSARAFSKIDLTDPRQQLDWPMLVRFAELKRRESKLDSQVAEKERARLGAWGRERGIPLIKSEFRNPNVETNPNNPKKQNPNVFNLDHSNLTFVSDFGFRNSDLRSFWESFYAAASPRGFDFKDYPALSLSEGFHILQGEMEGPRFFEEADLLRDEILEALIQNPEKERPLLEQAREFLFLKKLFGLELTPGELEKVEGRRRKVEGGRSKVEGKGNSNIETVYQNAMRFYETARKRDRIMFRKIMEVTSKGRRSKVEGRSKPFLPPSTFHLPPVVVIAGGFHTPGLTTLLKDKNVSYAVVSPHLPEIDDNGKYIAAMLGQKHPLDLSAFTVRMPNWITPRTEWRETLPPAIVERRAEMRRAIEKVGLRHGATIRPIEGAKTIRELRTIERSVQRRFKKREGEIIAFQQIGFSEVFSKLLIREGMKKGKVDTKFWRIFFRQLSPKVKKFLRSFRGHKPLAPALIPFTAVAATMFERRASGQKLYAKDLAAFKAMVDFSNAHRTRKETLLSLPLIFILNFSACDFREEKDFVKWAQQLGRLPGDLGDQIAAFDLFVSSTHEADALDLKVTLPSLKRVLRRLRDKKLTPLKRERYQWDLVIYLLGKHRFWESEPKNITEIDTEEMSDRELLRLFTQFQSLLFNDPRNVAVIHNALEFSWRKILKESTAAGIHWDSFIERVYGPYLDDARKYERENRERGFKHYSAPLDETLTNPDQIFGEDSEDSEFYELSRNVDAARKYFLELVKLVKRRSEMRRTIEEAGLARGATPRTETRQKSGGFSQREVGVEVSEFGRGHGARGVENFQTKETSIFGHNQKEKQIKAGISFSSGNNYQYPILPAPPVQREGPTKEPRKPYPFHAPFFLDSLGGSKDSGSIKKATIEIPKGTIASRSLALGVTSVNSLVAMVAATITGTRLSSIFPYSNLLRGVNTFHFPYANDLPAAQGRQSQADHSKVANREIKRALAVGPLYQSKSWVIAWLNRMQLIPIPILMPQPHPLLSSLENDWNSAMICFMAFGPLGTDRTLYFINGQQIILLSSFIKELKIAQTARAEMRGGINRRDFFKLGAGAAASAGAAEGSHKSAQELLSPEELETLGGLMKLYDEWPKEGFLWGFYSPRSMIDLRNKAAAIVTKIGSDSPLAQQLSSKATAFYQAVQAAEQSLRSNILAEDRWGQNFQALSSPVSARIAFEHPEDLDLWHIITNQFVTDPKYDPQLGSIGGLLSQFEFAKSKGWKSDDYFEYVVAYDWKPFAQRQVKRVAAELTRAGLPTGENELFASLMTGALEPADQKERLRSVEGWLESLRKERLQTALNQRIISINDALQGEFGEDFNSSRMQSWMRWPEKNGKADLSQTLDEMTNHYRRKRKRDAFKKVVTRFMEDRRKAGASVSDERIRAELANVESLSESELEAASPQKIQQKIEEEYPVHSFHDQMKAALQTPRLAPSYLSKTMLGRLAGYLERAARTGPVTLHVTADSNGKLDNVQWFSKGNRDLKKELDRNERENLRHDWNTFQPRSQRWIISIAQGMTASQLIKIFHTPNWTTLGWHAEHKGILGTVLDSTLVPPSIQLGTSQQNSRAEMRRAIENAGLAHGATIHEEERMDLFDSKKMFPVIDRGAEMFQKVQPKQAGDLYDFGNVMANNGKIFNNQRSYRKRFDHDQRNVNRTVRRYDRDRLFLSGGIVSKLESRIPGNHGINRSRIKNQINLNRSSRTRELNTRDDNPRRFFGKRDFDHGEVLRRIIEKSLGILGPVYVIYRWGGSRLRRRNFWWRWRRSLSAQITFPSSLDSFVNTNAIQLSLNLFFAAASLIEPSPFGFSVSGDAANALSIERKKQWHKLWLNLPAFQSYGFIFLLFLTEYMPSLQKRVSQKSEVRQDEILEEKPQKNLKQSLQPALSWNNPSTFFPQVLFDWAQAYDFPLAQGRQSQADQSRVARSDTKNALDRGSLYQSKSSAMERLKRKELIPMPTFQPHPQPRLSSSENDWNSAVINFMVLGPLGAKGILLFINSQQIILLSSFKHSLAPGQLVRAEIRREFDWREPYHVKVRPDQSYRVEVTESLFDPSHGLLKRQIAPTKAGKIFVIAEAGWEAEVAALKRYLESRKLPGHQTLIIPKNSLTGKGKTADILMDRIQKQASDFHAGRKDLFILLGSEKLRRVASRAAATFHRGIPYIVIPTEPVEDHPELIGIQTGIQKSSGVFDGLLYPPRAVLIDLRYQKLAKADLGTRLELILKEQRARFRKSGDQWKIIRQDSGFDIRLRRKMDFSVEMVPGVLNWMARYVGRRKSLYIVDQQIGEKPIQELKSKQNLHENQILVLSGGEEVKDEKAGKRHVEMIHRRAQELGMTSKDAFVLIGGGAVLDVAGFAASRYDGGTAHIRIPTTLLAQIDAGIGVKNGINKFNQKNFEGIFQPAEKILIDPSFLSSLDDRTLRSGMAEMVKVALMKDRHYFGMLEKYYRHVLDPKWRAGDRALELMWASIVLHLEQIRTDPFETLLARPLDYGHEYGHRFERVTAEKFPLHVITHGEGVWLGTAIDTVISWQRGYISKKEMERVLDLIDAMGWHNESVGAIPTYDPRATHDDLEPGLESFRIHLGGELTISLLERIGKKKDVHRFERDEQGRVMALVKALAFLQDRYHRRSRELISERKMVSPRSEMRHRVKDFLADLEKRNQPVVILDPAANRKKGGEIERLLKAHKIDKKTRFNGPIVIATSLGTAAREMRERGLGAAGLLIFLGVARQTRFRLYQNKIMGELKDSFPVKSLLLLDLSKTPNPGMKELEDALSDLLEKNAAPAEDEEEFDIYKTPPRKTRVYALPPGWVSRHQGILKLLRKKPGEFKTVRELTKQFVGHSDPSPKDIDAIRSAVRKIQGGNFRELGSKTIQSHNDLRESFPKDVPAYRLRKSYRTYSENKWKKIIDSVDGRLNRAEARSVNQGAPANPASAEIIIEENHFDKLDQKRKEKLVAAILEINGEDARRLSEDIAYALENGSLKGKVFLARDQETAVGYSWIIEEPAFKWAEYYRLVVKKGWRNQGIAKKLADRTFQYLQNQNIFGLKIDIDFDDREALTYLDRLIRPQNFEIRSIEFHYHEKIYAAEENETLRAFSERLAKKFPELKLEPAGLFQMELGKLPSPNGQKVKAHSAYGLLDWRLRLWGMLFGLFLKDRVTFEGIENLRFLKKGQGFLLVGNHISQMASALIAPAWTYRFKRLPLFVANTLYVDYLQQQLMQWGGAIPVQRGSTTWEIVKHLRADNIVAILPAGKPSRYPSRDLDKWRVWRNSFAIAALETGKPIIPFSLSGDAPLGIKFDLGYWLTLYRKRGWKGVWKSLQEIFQIRLHIKIGEPIYPPTRIISPENVEALKELTIQRVAKGLVGQKINGRTYEIAAGLRPGSRAESRRNRDAATGRGGEINADAGAATHPILQSRLGELRLRLLQITQLPFRSFFPPQVQHGDYDKAIHHSVLLDNRQHFGEKGFQISFLGRKFVDEYLHSVMAGRQFQAAFDEFVFLRQREIPSLRIFSPNGIPERSPEEVNRDLDFIESAPAFSKVYQRYRPMSKHSPIALQNQDAATRRRGEGADATASILKVAEEMTAKILPRRSELRELYGQLFPAAFAGEAEAVLTPEEKEIYTEALSEIGKRGANVVFPSKLLTKTFVDSLGRILQEAGPSANGLKIFAAGEKLSWPLGRTQFIIPKEGLDPTFVANRLADDKKPVAASLESEPSSISYARRKFTGFIVDPEFQNFSPKQKLHYLLRSTVLLAQASELSPEAWKAWLQEMGLNVRGVSMPQMTAQSLEKAFQILQQQLTQKSA